MKKSKELCSLWNNEQEVQTGNVKISELHEFKGHPFRVEHDMHLFELSRSIEEKGVIRPPSFSMWRQIWCACARHCQSG